jgi:hypothetical protein
MSSDSVLAKVDTANGAVSGHEPSFKMTKVDGNGRHDKLTLLRDKVQSISQKCKREVGLSANEIGEYSPTADSFFDAVAAERLRWMPRDGSSLDVSLRWASRLACAVNSLREAVRGFATGADEAATLIWGCCLLLLRVSCVRLTIFPRLVG